MAEKLIALQDINDTIRAGDHFEAPDRIFVALGLAEVEPPSESDEPVVDPQSSRRRGRVRGRSAS